MNKLKNTTDITGQVDAGVSQNAQLCRCGKKIKLNGTYDTHCKCGEEFWYNVLTHKYVRWPEELRSGYM